MWLIDSLLGNPFERDLKRLAKDERKIATALSRMIAMEAKELNILQQEERQIVEGTPIVKKLYDEIEGKKKNAGREKVHDPARLGLVNQEMDVILSEEQILREIYSLNSDLQRETAGQEHLLRQAHQYTMELRNLYGQLIGCNSSIGNQSTIITMNHLLQGIIDNSVRKANMVDQIENIRAEKENKKKRIVELCKKMKMDEETIKNIAGQIISKDKLDRNITNQMSHMQFA